MGPKYVGFRNGVGTRKASFSLILLMQKCQDQQKVLCYFRLLIVWESLDITSVLFYSGIFSCYICNVALLQGFFATLSHFL